MPAISGSAPLRSIGWMLAVAVVVRVAIALSYEPARFSDSGTYLRFAEQILALDFSGYDGWRTPGYPLLLAALGPDDRWVAVAQMAMGIATTMILYRVALDATGARWAGVAAALTHALALNQLVLEASVLAETFACFLVTLVMWVGLRSWQRGWTLGGVCLLGALCAVAALIRPLYVVVGGVVLILLVFFGPQRRMAAVTVFLACVSAPLLGWFAFNQAMLGYFGMTTLLGYNLTNHSGAIMELAPAEYAVIRDVYLEHRARRLAEGKSHTMTIFDAREDLKSATGKSDAQLSRDFQRLSLALFAEHPGAYLAGVSRAWAGYWSVPTYWKPENVDSPSVRAAFERTAALQRWMLRAGYALFLILAMPILWLAWVRERGSDAGWNAAGILAATVLAASVLQALLEYGENARYALPTQSLAMTAAIIAIALFAARGRRAEPPIGSRPQDSAGAR